MLPFSIMAQYGNVVVINEYDRFYNELITGTNYTLMNSGSPFNTYNTNTLNGYSTVINTVGGTMWGSPYGTRVTYDSRIHYAIRHMYPSESMFLTAASKNRLVAFTRTTFISYPSYLSVTRNGYTSTSYGSFQGCLLTDFVYYDEDTGYVMRYNPNTISTPIRYYS